MIEVKQEAAFHFSLVEVLPVCLMMSSLVMSLIPALIGSDPMVQLHGGCVTRRSTRKGELLQRPLSTVPSVFVFSDVGVAARPLGGSSHESEPSSSLRGASCRGFLGFTVNVYKYIFCMYAFPNDVEKIDVIFIYCSRIFVSILYFLIWFSVKQEYYVNIVL